jgi:hypothetical protein
MPSPCTLMYVFFPFLFFFFALFASHLRSGIARTSICAHVQSNSLHSRLPQQGSSCAYGAHGVRLMKTPHIDTRAPDSPRAKPFSIWAALSAADSAFVHRRFRHDQRRITHGPWREEQVSTRYNPRRCVLRDPHSLVLMHLCFQVISQRRREGKDRVLPGSQ